MTCVYDVLLISYVCCGCLFIYSCMNIGLKEQMQKQKISLSPVILRNIKFFFKLLKSTPFLWIAKFSKQLDLMK